MRGAFLESIARKVRVRRWRSADEGSSDTVSANTDFENYLSSTDPANSSCDSSDDRSEASDSGALQRSISFIDFDEVSVQIPRQSSKPTIAIKQDSFEWVDILKDNIDNI